jgi:hypothetical protein
MRRFSPGADLDTVIGARAVGLSPEFFGEMRGMFPRLSLDDAVGMRAVGVTGDYASSMRQLFPTVTADQLTDMRATGVSADFVKAMRREGLPAADPDQAIEGRQMGREMIKAGKRGPTAIAVVPGAIAISGPNGNVNIAVPDEPDDPDADDN